jgi:tetratricopeptide (TPR) repeat protein
LRDAPHETRLAGRALAHMGLGEKLILARKPHVAYFAGMRTEALPLDVRLADLPRWARTNSAEYLFYSGLELSQRPEWGVLADSAVTLPGFEPIAWDRLPRGHFYAVYRLHDVGADSVTFARAYAAALDRCEALHPDSPSALLFVAVQRLGLGDARAALRDLDRLKAGGARDVSVEQYRCLALLALGDLDGAAASCEASLQLAPPTAWRWAKLGEIRTRQGKKDAARDAYAHAVALASTNLEYVELLGKAQIDTRHFADAAQTFEQAVRLAPRDATARRYAMGAWQLAGNAPRMEAIYREGIAAGITPQELTGRAGPAPAPAPAR